MRWIILGYLCFSIIFTHPILAQPVPELEHSWAVSDSAVDAIAYSPDGARIATGGRDNIIRVWDTLTNDLIMATEGHTNWITDLAFTPDSTQLISASRDNSIRRFDATTGALLGVIGQHNSHITAIAVTPDNRYILSGGRDDVIKLWDAESGTLIESVVHLEAVWDIAISPSGSRFASASDSGQIHIWLIRDNQLVLQSTINAHGDAVTAIAFSDDGTKLLSASIDRNIHLWHVNHPIEPIITFTGHQASVTGIGFTQSSNHIISTSLDGTTRLWNMTTEPDNSILLEASETPMLDLATSPDLSQIARISIDGTINSWDTTAPNIDTLANMTFVETGNDASSSISEFSSTEHAILSLPTIDLDIAITTFPLGGNSWDIDPWETLVGHFEGTAWLNQPGNLVLGGHSEMPDGTDGIFNDLYNVGIGDEISVQDAGIIRHYLIVNIKSVDYRDISVVMPTLMNRVTLITCDIPSYVAEQNLYYERLVVIAEEITH